MNRFGKTESVHFTTKKNDTTRYQACIILSSLHAYLFALVVYFRLCSTTQITSQKLFWVIFFSSITAERMVKKVELWRELWASWSSEAIDMQLKQTWPINPPRTRGSHTEMVFCHRYGGIWDRKLKFGLPFLCLWFSLNFWHFNNCHVWFGDWPIMSAVYSRLKSSQLRTAVNAWLSFWERCDLKKWYTPRNSHFASHFIS